MKSHTRQQKRARIIAIGGFWALDNKARDVLDVRDDPDLFAAWKIAGLDDGHALLDWFEDHLEWWLIQQETQGAIQPNRRFA